MFDPPKALLLRSGDELALAQEAGGGIGMIGEMPRMIIYRAIR
jgi:hypothetical protein